MEIHADLEVGQRQQLVLTARMEQRLRLLQAPITELVEILSEAACGNPFLELDEEMSDPGAEERPGEEESEDPLDEGAAEPRGCDWSRPGASPPPDWREQVLAQARLGSLEENERRVAEYILGSLDEHGWLPGGAAEVASALGADPLVVEIVRRRVMRVEPGGLAATGLIECLAVQLELRGAADSLAGRLVAEGLPDLARRRYRRLAARLGASPDAIRRAAAVVRGLCPCPRRAIEIDRAPAVYPDLRVERVGERYEVFIEEGLLPRLRLVPPPAMGAGRRSEGLAAFVRSGTARARWLLEGVSARRATLTEVMKLVVEEQAAFFDHGVHRLKPLIYRQLADRLGVHESTVARAVRGKYVQTPRGVLPLRFFFAKGLSGSAGRGRTPASVRARLREMIATETAARPLTDEDLARMLRVEGVRVSRRTVAKYRDSMRIAKASYRRQA